MNLAVIPARGGSKRIPRKNIKDFCGRPMIAWAIGAAQESGCFDRVVVSTDDVEIAAVAREWGGEVPFVRPSQLADDFTPTVPVIEHAICECEKIGWKIDLACCIYPCVPLIHVDDLKEAMRLLQHSSHPYIFPVAEFPSPIYRAFCRDTDGKLFPFFEKNELERTQDLKVAYYDAGQFYWGNRSAWKNFTRIHSYGYGIVIPGWRVVDIDTQDDWIRAETIFKLLHGEVDGKYKIL
jgi:pseudaminic acid cytidylyltransferase